MTNILKVCIFVISCAVFSTNLYASNIVTKQQCHNKGEEFIFAGGECIQFYISEGEKESEINIIVHGTWPEGTNTLGRYAPFADNLSMATDITTIAVALPGYSKSSTNKFAALSHNGTKHLAAQKEYIEFLSHLVSSLKKRYEAQKVNYIGHSAGAFIGSTLTGFTPGLITTMISAGAGYDIHSKVKNSKGLISLIDYLDNIDKNTKFLLIYGTKDEVSKPKITKEYYNTLVKKGFNASLIEVIDAPHIDLDMTDTSIEAITEILEEE
ncbi:alpha/beta hydrolase [Arcobacteraceae bacterium]|nr:alpha/beta hydrolase [Arcobacteraceae bacterium]